MDTLRWWSSFTRSDVRASPECSFLHGSYIQTRYLQAAKGALQEEVRGSDKCGVQNGHKRTPAPRSPQLRHIRPSAFWRVLACGSYTSPLCIAMVPRKIASLRFCFLHAARVLFRCLHRQCCPYGSCCFGFASRKLGSLGRKQRTQVGTLKQAKPMKGLKVRRAGGNTGNTVLCLAIAIAIAAEFRGAAMVKERLSLPCSKTC